MALPLGTTWDDINKLLEGGLIKPLSNKKAALLS
jgi:hypothetical protein